MTIRQAYDWIGADYSEVTEGTYRRVWERVNERFGWPRTPSVEMLRRLFNQINSHYAEAWLLSNAQDRPKELLLEANRLLLYRQGKAKGYRTRRIEYGVRSHLDFMDPWRRERWLRGVPPDALPSTMDAWETAIEYAQPSHATALLLAMSVIGIHPFSDANGRTARLIYSWLCVRWSLEPRWLSEGADGEVLVTGHGLQSTTYLMAMLMIALADGHCIVEPGESGRPSPTREAAMVEAILVSLGAIASPNGLLGLAAFQTLREHLQSNGHIRSTSPRFECLADTAS